MWTAFGERTKRCSAVRRCKSNAIAIVAPVAASGSWSASAPSMLAVDAEQQAKQEGQRKSRLTCLNDTYGDAISGVVPAVCRSGEPGLLAAA